MSREPQHNQEQGGRSRALTVANQQVAVLREKLESKREAITRLIGGDRRAEALMMAALMRASDDPKIRECDPNSVVRAVVQAALCGANVAAGLGEGYLVPYFNRDLGVKECSFMPGYRLGERNIHEASGLRVIADVVCEHDEFEFSQVPLRLRHVPNLLGDRGLMLLSYAVAIDDHDKVMFAQVATAHDIEQAKAASRKGRDQDSPAWRQWEDRMWRKVAIMRLAKEVRAFRSSDKLDRLIEAEAEAFEGQRSYLGELPEPRTQPAGLPEPGRGKIGASRRPRVLDDTLMETKPLPQETEKRGPEPEHDPKTGEVKDGQQDLGY